MELVQPHVLSMTLCIKIMKIDFYWKYASFHFENHLYNHKNNIEQLGNTQDNIQTKNHILEITLE